MIDQATQQAVEAAVFRRLLEHLDSRKDVQNIELMNLAGFCRNCLSKWYVQAAREHGAEVADEVARERVYGMPYGEWKQRYQTEASAAQKAAFDKK
jgi:hypothetical protein